MSRAYTQTPLRCNAQKVTKCSDYWAGWHKRHAGRPSYAELPLATLWLSE
jgi:hypothetical protein